MRGVAFWIFIVVVAAYAVAAGFTDLRMRRIPNYLTVPMAIAGLVCSVTFSLLKKYSLDLPGYPYPTEVLDCLLGFGLGFGIFFIPFLSGGGGSGDLKLVAALGAWLGWSLFAVGLGDFLDFRHGLRVRRLDNQFFGERRQEQRKRKTPTKSGATTDTARPKARRRQCSAVCNPDGFGHLVHLGGLIVEKYMFQQVSKCFTDQRSSICGIVTSVAISPAFCMESFMEAE